jgi:hypothetical protein
MIFVEVIDANTVKLRLRGGVPKGASVKAWVQKHGAEASKDSLIFNATPTSLPKVGEFAAAFRFIVCPGAPRYDEKAYKYGLVQSRVTCEAGLVLPRRMMPP